MPKKKLTGKSEFTQEEMAIRLRDGFELRFPQHPDACEYVRITDEDGEEQVYWHYKEFEEDARDVLGALMGAISEHMQTEDDDE
jgi:hypothetical protein